MRSEVLTVTRMKMDVSFLIIQNQWVKSVICTLIYVYMKYAYLRCNLLCILGLNHSQYTIYMRVLFHSYLVVAIGKLIMHSGDGRDSFLIVGGL